MRKQNNVSSLSPRIKHILHYVSISSSFLMLWGILVIIQSVTLGMIPHVWDWTIMKIPVVPIMFSLISAGIVLKFGRFDSPYR